MVMLFDGLLKARKGQSRILEAAIAVVAIFIVFSVSMFLIRASNVRVLEERADLDRVGYNVLHRLVESGTIGGILETFGPGLREDHLKIAVQQSLPSTHFNLTIYDCVDKGSYIQLQRLTSVSNALGDTFANSLEVSSTNVICTSKGHIYYVVLILAKVGGV